MGSGLPKVAKKSLVSLRRKAVQSFRMKKPLGTIGPYRVLRLLGEGGMGTVFEAVQEDIERRVALKFLKPEYAKNTEAVARLLNEARAVNRIEHPSLVQISDHGRTEAGAVYLVMEFLRGETLNERLKRLQSTGEKLPLEQALRITWQIAEALAAAHDKGVIHRDLKPDNIMLVPDPATLGGERAKILDFGVAKLLQVSCDVTVQPRMIGTPRYMAPEQIRALSIIDGRADVYSLGVVLFLMVAGQPPFLGTELEALLGQHLFEPPPDLQELAVGTPKELARLVARMLEKTSGSRPHMTEVLAALPSILLSSQDDAVVRDLATATATALMPPPMVQAPTTFVYDAEVRRTGERGPFRSLGAVLAGVALVGGAGTVTLWSQHGSRQKVPPSADSATAQRAGMSISSSEAQTSRILSTVGLLLEVSAKLATESLAAPPVVKEAAQVASTKKTQEVPGSPLAPAAPRPKETTIRSAATLGATPKKSGRSELGVPAVDSSKVRTSAPKELDPYDI